MGIRHRAGRCCGLWTRDNGKGHIVPAWALGWVHALGLPLLLAKTLDPALYSRPGGQCDFPPLVTVTIAAAILVATAATTAVTAAITDTDDMTPSHAC